jgi:ENTS family enterobactin (siderophore) exporter
LTLVAAPLQIYQMTGSTLAVGLLGLVQLPVLVIGSFLGGSLADSYDRRRLLLFANVALAATSGALALNASLGRPAVWLVYALTSVSAFLSGIDYPARTSSIPRLVAIELLPATYAIRVLVFQTANAVGPAIAGILIANLSLSVAYWADAATYVAALGLVALLRPLPPQTGRTRAGWSAIRDGLRFIRTKPEVQGVFLIDINAMVFGMPRALFPEMGVTVFGGDATTVGYLFAAPGVGSMLAGITSGWVGRVRRAGLATIVGVITWGIGITLFGFTPTFSLAILALVAAGVGDAVSAVFRQTILQTTTPDDFRGRVSSVQNAVVAGGPRIGDVRAGLVASTLGAQVAAWSGGLLSIVGALVVGRLLPGFGKWAIPGTESQLADGE